MSALSILSQVGILVFGAASIILVGSGNPFVRRWGYVSALVAEPFWFYASLFPWQPGIFVVTVIYTVAWARGLKNNWVSQPKW